VDHEKDATELKITVTKKKEPRKKKDTTAFDKPSDN
jgi:hypothetical protein